MSKFSFFVTNLNLTIDDYTRVHQGKTKDLAKLNFTREKLQRISHPAKTNYCHRRPLTEVQNETSFQNKILQNKGNSEFKK